MSNLPAATSEKLVYDKNPATPKTVISRIPATASCFPVLHFFIAVPA